MKRIIVLQTLLLLAGNIYPSGIKTDKTGIRRGEQTFIVLTVVGKALPMTNIGIRPAPGIRLLNINPVNPYLIYIRIQVEKTAPFGKAACALTAGKREYPFSLYILPPQQLLLDLNAYDEFFFRFRFGYEYSSMDKIFEEGFPRLGFFVNFTSRSERHPGLGLQVSGDFMLSSTPFINKTAGVTNETMIDKAFEFYGTVFFHLFRTRMKMKKGDIHAYFGPVITAGSILKNDFTGQSSYQIYGGFRMSINPEVYTDLLFGKSEELESYRFFIRAHLPIFRLSDTSRLYLGAFLNFSMDTEKVDFIRIFLSADFDPIKLLTSIF